MIAALHLTPYGRLDAFRAERLGPESCVSLDHLAMVRDVLSVLVDALRDDDDDTWRRLREVTDQLSLRETMVPDPPTPHDEPMAWRDGAGLGPNPTAVGRERGPEARGSATEWPEGSRAAPLAPPAAELWGQAYAPGSLPPGEVEERRSASAAAAASLADDLTPPRGYARSSASSPTGGATTYPQAPPPAVNVLDDEDSATHELSLSSRAHPLAMSVEDYATFCAERDADPEHTVTIARRYAIPDARVLALVSRSFEWRMARDADLHRRWREAYARRREAPPASR